MTRQLVARAGVSLTIAINGYDDGASTGEVRRFLGDSLGPSDFRKNAARLATELKTCSPELLAIVESRLPPDITSAAAVEHLTRLIARPGCDGRLVDWITAFLYEYSRTGASFAFGDCSVGNLVFAGAYLRARRDFYRAVDD